MISYVRYYVYTVFGCYITVDQSSFVNFKNMLKYSGQQYHLSVHKYEKEAFIYLDLFY